jgi:hypothetical protein
MPVPRGRGASKGARESQPPPQPSCRRDSHPASSFAHTHAHYCGIYRSCGPAAALPRQQLSRGDAPTPGAHVFFGRTSVPVLPTAPCSALLVFSNARGGSGIGTGRSGRGTTREAASQGWMGRRLFQRAMSSRSASLPPPACLPADAFACGPAGTARHGGTGATSGDKT